jgi:hypothetical protein
MQTDEIRELIEQGKHLIPPYMWGGIERYMISRIPPGHFLTALLSNNLMEAFARADDLNQANMQRYCQFLYNYAPRGSYGSPAAVREWLNPAVQEAA